MLPGPIFRREVHASARGFRMHRIRIVLGIGMFFFILAPILFVLTANQSLQDLFDVSRIEAARIFSAYVVAVMFGLEALILSLFAAGAVGASIAEEREKDTLPLLLLTRLTRFELVAVKLIGRLMPVLLTILMGLPLIVVGAWLSDLSPRSIGLSLAALTVTIITAGSFGILASSRHDLSASGGREGIGWMTLWMFVMPTAALFPVRSGTLWGELLVEMRRVARWLSPSSPLSLITDPSWFSSFGNSDDRLAVRLIVMMAMQGVLIVLAISGAMAALRLREPRANAPEVRPPVGDDPIYWREYEMARHNFGGSVVIFLIRQLLIMIRTLLFSVLMVFGSAAGLAFPLGMIVATGWFGYHSFNEFWGLNGWSGAGFPARQNFNIFIRYATFLFGPIAALGAASSVTTQITIERDKKTWESLLMTPLTGAELLGSKLRVASKTVRSMVRWLIPLWGLGILCGALQPVGVVLATLALMAISRLAMAINLRAVLRPGATTQSANSSAGLWTLALMVVGFVTVIVPLCSTQDIQQRLRSIDPWLPEAGIVLELAIIVVMAAWGESLRRRCFDRFDEWVGRPHRDPGAPDGGRQAEQPATMVGVAAEGVE